MLTRLQGWDTQLLPGYLEACAQLPFAWGRHDCCLFAAGAVQAITGTDIATDFRTGYKTEAGAYRLIKRLTGGKTAADAAEFCAAKHRLREYTWPKFAGRGDLVVLENGDRLIAGVVNLDGRYAVSVGQAGLLYLPFDRIRRAWSV